MAQWYKHLVSFRKFYIFTYFSSEIKRERLDVLGKMNQLYFEAFNLL